MDSSIQQRQKQPRWLVVGTVRVPSPRYSRSHLSIVFAFCHSIPYSLFLSVSFSIQSNPIQAWALTAKKSPTSTT